MTAVVDSDIISQDTVADEATQVAESGELQLQRKSTGCPLIACC